MMEAGHIIVAFYCVVWTAGCCIDFSSDVYMLMSILPFTIFSPFPILIHHFFISFYFLIFSLVSCHVISGYKAAERSMGRPEWGHWNGIDNFVYIWTGCCFLPQPDNFLADPNIITRN